MPPKKVKDVVWRYCCPVALETTFVAGARGIGMHMVSVLLPEMVKPNVPKASTKTATIRPSPRGDRDTMHASSAYSIPQIARRTHSSAVSGPTFDGCSCRWIRSASMHAFLLNFSSATKSIAAKNKLNSNGGYASLTEPLCHLEPLQALAVITLPACSHPIVELADHLYHLRRCSEASKHLP